MVGRQLRQHNATLLFWATVFGVVSVAAPASAATYIVDTDALTISAVTLQDKCVLSIGGVCLVTVHGHYQQLHTLQL